MDLEHPNQTARGAGAPARWSRLRKQGRVLAAVLGLLTTIATSAQALDLCVDYTGGGVGFALKRFKAPSKNKCAAAQGFDRADYAGALSGTVCTNSEGTGMIFHYTSHNYSQSTGYFESATCRIPLPLGSTAILGYCSGTFTVGGGSGDFWQDAQFYYCNANVPK